MAENNGRRYTTEDIRSAERMTAIEKDIETLKEGSASKVDVEKRLNQMLYTVIGVGALIVVGLITGLIRLFTN